jgi:hypothetical protein
MVSGVRSMIEICYESEEYLSKSLVKPAMVLRSCHIRDVQNCVLGKICNRGRVDKPFIYNVAGRNLGSTLALPNRQSNFRNESSSQCGKVWQYHGQTHD